MTARRVLLVHSSSGRYGADRQLKLIATGLDRDRYEASVVLPDRGELAGDLEAAGIEVLVRPLGVIRRQLATPRGAARVLGAATRDARALSRLIRERDVALVHSNTSVVLGGASGAMLARVPHVWHVREIYTRLRGLWPVHRRLLATAAALPCVSRATAAQFGRSSRARVIYDALAVAVSHGSDKTPPGPAVIAVVGRVSEWKGQDVLVRALAEPPLAEVGALGLIAGQAWPGAEDRLSRVLVLAERLGVRDRVRLAGFQDDVASVYAQADLVAVPSTAPDPLPGAAIEAAAAGRPVIASAHGGLLEIIRDGETGRLVPPGDPAALARVARELLDDPAARERLGAAAARDVRERFSAERLLGEIQALYDSVLAASR